MAVDVVVGLQRGDEGKGRFVDMLAEEYEAVARFNGGDNAGHTVVLPDGSDLKLHLIPSGIARPEIVNVIGTGTVVNPVNLAGELDGLDEKGLFVSPQNLKISSAAHLILPHHISEDEIREAGAGNQGSTKRGIAQVSSSKSMREGVRVEMINNEPDELLELVRDGLRMQRATREEVGLPELDEAKIAEEYLRKACQVAAFATDTALYLNKLLKSGGNVLAEGAQAFLLDVDHGMYPYTTSSTTTAGGVSPGLGVPPHYIGKVTGVAKAVQSHVGGGPFPTEITEEDTLSLLHGDMTTIDAERGTTTNRTRRLGFFDLPGVRRANMINGTSELALTKLDWVPRYGSEVAVCVSYDRKGKQILIAPDSARKLNQSTPHFEHLPTWEEDITEVRNFDDLPGEAQDYVKFLEEQTDTPITMIGVGPRRDQVIVRNPSA